MLVVFFWNNLPSYIAKNHLNMDVKIFNIIISLPLHLSMLLLGALVTVVMETSQTADRDQRGSASNQNISNEEVTAGDYEKSFELMVLRAMLARNNDKLLIWNIEVPNERILRIRLTWNYFNS